MTNHNVCRLWHSHGYLIFGHISLIKKKHHLNYPLQSAQIASDVGMLLTEQWHFPDIMLGLFIWIKVGLMSHDRTVLHLHGINIWNKSNKTRQESANMHNAHTDLLFLSSFKQVHVLFSSSYEGHSVAKHTKFIKDTTVHFSVTITSSTHDLLSPEGMDKVLSVQWNCVN